MMTRQVGLVYSVWIVLVIVVFVFVIYEALPELIFHTLHVSVLFHARAGRESRLVALTFDDGPDPRYTPRVLDLLDAAGAKATFFLVGRRAASHPELVWDIQRRGHLIANHTQSHMNAWATSPWNTFREIRRGKATLEAILGKAVRFYRPPWGMFNALTRLACAAVGQRPVLWSVAGFDWRAGDQTQNIIRRVSGVMPGGIVLLHDAGGAEGAPENTIRALPAILQMLAERGLQSVTVEELISSPSQT